jgi:hypothetical protein
VQISCIKEIYINSNSSTKKLISQNIYKTLISTQVPFEDESKRNEENGSYCLSIENKDEIVHSMIKCSFGK